MGDITEEKTDVRPERKVTIAQLARVVLHRPIVDLSTTKKGSLLAAASETVKPMKREEETQTRRRAVKPNELDAIIRDSNAVQVRIGPEGTLVLDTASSSVSRTQLQEQTGANLERVQVSTRPYTNCFARLRRAPSKRWSNQETELFYKALAFCGTDFTMMALIFPDRQRENLKLKFKREEKINPAKVHRALNRPLDSGDQAALQLLISESQKLRTNPST